LQLHKLRSQRRQPLGLTVRLSPFDSQVGSLDEAQLAQALDEGRAVGLRKAGRGTAEPTDAIAAPSLLGRGPPRPGDHRAPNQCNNPPSPHPAPPFTVKGISLADDLAIRSAAWWWAEISSEAPPKAAVARIGFRCIDSWVFLPPFPLHYLSIP